MKDRSLIFVCCLVGGFLVLGSAMLFRVSPETLPERARVALNTAGLKGLEVAFDGQDAYLLGEAPDEHSLGEAVEVVGRVRGVGSVDRTHATVRRKLESPQMSLVFAGDQISVRGRVSGEETKEGILAQLREQFPEAEIHADRLVVREDVEDYGEFARATEVLPGVGEKERGRGVVAAVGGDLKWVVLPSGAGMEEITAGLATVLPESEVEETKDEFDDVLTAENLKDERETLRGEVEEARADLKKTEGENAGLVAGIEEVRLQLKEATVRAQMSDAMLKMSQEELAKREDDLDSAREELVENVRALAETKAMRDLLTENVRASEAALEQAELENAKLAEEAEAKYGALKENFTKGEEEVAQMRFEFSREIDAVATELAEVRAKLAESEARAKDLEAKVTGMNSARATPGSSAGGEILGAAPAKEIDAARGAAAAAAEAARKSAANSVEQTEEMKKGRGEVEAEGKTEEAEVTDPSGKPVPSGFAIPGKASKLEALRRYSAKNVGRAETGRALRDLRDGESGLGGGEAIWKQVEERDQLILDLEERLRAEREADGEVIGALQEENAELREALDRVTEGDSSGEVEDAATAVEQGTVFRRPEGLEGRLRSVLSYP